MKPQGIGIYEPDKHEIFKCIYLDYICFIVRLSIGHCEYMDYACDGPNPGGPLTTRQPAEDSWMSGNLIPHH